MKMVEREQGRAVEGRKTESLGIDFIMKVCGGHAAPRIGVRQNRLLLPVDGNWVKKTREILVLMFEFLFSVPNRFQSVRSFRYESWDI